MRNATTMNGRASLWLVVALALGAITWLLVGDPLHLFGPGTDREGAGGAADGSLDGRGAGSAAANAREAGGGLKLEGLYGAGDLGGLRLRVMDAATNAARAKQDVRLSGKAGAEEVLATGSDGSVVFGKLAPGRGWSLRIEGQGFRAVTLEGFVVRPGAVTDLGEVWVGQNVVLRGRVLDPSGRPLPKASVAAFGSDRTNAGQGLVVFLVGQALAVPLAKEEVTTDDEGWFRFLALADGVYSLVAKHPGHGMRQQNDVVVSPKSASSPVLIRLVEGARLTGRVNDPEGRPVPGARVIALRDTGQRFSLSGVLERDEAVADQRGEYRLDTLVDGGSYRFGVVAEGFAGAWDQGPMEITRALERDFRLSRGGYIEGRVIEDGSGTPVADATVTVVVGRFSMGGMGGGGRGGRGGPAATPAAPSDPTTPALARTNAEGRFRLGPVLPGPVMSAVIKASGYASASSSLFTGNAWPDVSAEQPVTVEVALKRGGAIEGVVRTADGQPVPNAGIVAVQSGNMAAMWVGSPAASTDAKGYYRVDGAPPGDYHLAVDAPGYVLATTGEDAAKTTVPAEGGTVTLDLTLSSAGSILGQVKDGKGEPLAGVRVRTRPALGDLFRGGPRGGGAGAGARMVEALKTSADLTDAQGRFRLTGVGSAVEWTVEAEAEDYVLAQSERLKVLPGETKEVALVLTGGATLSGRVVGEGGSWVAGARVRIATLEKEDAERPFLSAFEVRRLLDPRVFFSDADGKYSIPNVKPGRVMVQVEHDDYVTYCKRNLTLAADQVLDGHAITLQKGEIVEGVVKGQDGKPISGALVFVTSRRNPASRDAEPAPADGGDSVEPQMSGQTDGDGKFRIENVPPGAWSVVVGFAQGHVGYFGSNDEAAIKRDLNVPVRDVEFRLKAQEAGGLPFGGARPAGVTPRPPVAPGTGGTGGTAPRPPGR